MLKSKLAAAATFLMMAAPALAHHRGDHGGGPPPRPTAVPEIDASAGLLAVAAVATIMLFAWERRRRQG